MTSKEFVLWLKGFTAGVHEYNISPKQWDTLKDTLEQVKDEQPIGMGFDVPNTQPFPIWQEPHTHHTNQEIPRINPNAIFGTCTAQSVVITTTPVGGSITYAKPQFVTSTTYGYPSGSSISYTNGREHNEN